MFNSQITHENELDIRLTYPVVLTPAAWNRLVYRSDPDKAAEIGKRLGIVVQALHRELQFNPNSSFGFGLYQAEADGDDRLWIELNVTVVTIIGQPPYLHIFLRSESA